MPTPAPKRRWYHLTPDRLFIGLLVVQVFLLLSERFQWFAFNERKGWTVLIAVGLIGVAVVVMLLWGLVCLCLRRRFQFSFRSLLLFLVAVSVPLGWLAVEMQRARRLREVVREVEGAHGAVYYDYKLDEYEPEDAESTTPRWMRNMLGNDFFYDVRTVEFISANVRVPGFTRAPYGDDEVMHLKALSSLRNLDLSHTEITNDSLVHSKGMTKLVGLGLADTQITDNGLANLKGITGLEWLSLNNTQITDEGLGHLKGMSKLEKLWLSDTQVTDEGVEELQEALPNCEIIHLPQP